MKTGEWTLRSRRVVTPSGTRPADVVIKGESIAEVASFDDPEREGVILDAGDMVVMPGLVALHLDGPVSLGENGLELATREAGAGGITTLIDLPPDVDPSSNPLSTLHARLRSASDKLRVDCGLIVGLGHKNADLVEAWCEAGVIGIEAFLGPPGRNGIAASTESDLRATMTLLASLGRPLLVHSERIGRSPGPPGESEPYRMSLPVREFDAIRLLIRLCRESRCGVHLIHPTATEALPMIAEARSAGLPITVETCPHYLSFVSDEIEPGMPTHGLNPSQRSPDCRERLWEGLRTGLIDAIGPDHPQAFATSGETIPPRPEFTSLRLALSTIWTEAERRGFTFDHVAKWMSRNPARTLGLNARKGAIDVGLDADLVVFDPEIPLTAEGRTFNGQVEATILRGSLIYQGGKFQETPKGNVYLRLEETLPMQGTDH